MQTRAASDSLGKRNGGATAQADGARQQGVGRRLLGAPGFGLFTALCVVLALATVALMGKAFADGHLFGLYQRLNYGVSVLWVAALALLTLWRDPRR